MDYRTRAVSTKLNHLAAQVNVPFEEYQEYDWHSRSSRYHRNQILEYFGFRSCVASDVKTLFDWLVEQVLPHEAAPERLKEIVAGRFLLLKIEPPTKGRIERLIRSAIHTYETNLFGNIHFHLSAESCASIDILLETSDLSEEHVTKPSVFQYLNSNPGRASLDNLLSEITKLEHLRKIGLPDELFANVSPKVLQTYARRAATEPP